MAERTRTRRNTLERRCLGKRYKRLFNGSVQRGDGGPNDTKAIASRLAQLRAQRSKLLGFPNYAAFNLDDEMAKTPENAIKFMTDMVPAATEKARGEAARMQKLIDQQGGGFKLQPWDWQYYAEQVRKAEYDHDESQVRPYFELDHVLRDGVFFAANKLYAITFKERKDVPAYHPDVRVRVLDLPPAHLTREGESRSCTAHVSFAGTASSGSDRWPNQLEPLENHPDIVGERQAHRRALTGEEARVRVQPPSPRPVSRRCSASAM